MVSLSCTQAIPVCPSTGPQACLMIPRQPTVDTAWSLGCRAGGLTPLVQLTYLWLLSIGATACGGCHQSHVMDRLHAFF